MATQLMVGWVKEVSRKKTGRTRRQTSFFIMVNLSQKYMKFPSIHSVVKGASQTFLRFPLAILLAVIATVFCILLVRVPYVFGWLETHFWYKNVIAAALLAALFSIALTVMPYQFKYQL